MKQNNQTSFRLGWAAAQIVERVTQGASPQVTEVAAVHCLLCACSLLEWRIGNTSLAASRGVYPVLSCLSSYVVRGGIDHRYSNLLAGGVANLAMTLEH